MMSSPHHVEFLSRSESRVEVLDAVREQPRTRNELEEFDIDLARLAHGTEIFYYDGDDTLVMPIIGDDAVQMCGHDEDGPAPGTIETTDPVVRSRAESYFESVGADAIPVETGTFGTITG